MNWNHILIIWNNLNLLHQIWILLSNKYKQIKIFMIFFCMKTQQFDTIRSCLQFTKKIVKWGRVNIRLDQSSKDTAMAWDSLPTPRNCVLNCSGVEFWWAVWILVLIRKVNLSRIGVDEADKLKVRQSRNQIMVFSILPKNEPNSLSLVKKKLRVLSFVLFLRELRTP